MRLRDWYLYLICIQCSFLSLLISWRARGQKSEIESQDFQTVIDWYFLLSLLSFRSGNYMLWPVGPSGWSVTP